MPLPGAGPPGFDARLAEQPMPPPGPDFYTARRQLWLAPRPGGSQPFSSLPAPRVDLEGLLRTEEALYTDSRWNKGIGKVWTRLSKGAHLQYRLPMDLVIKIVHASWVRDDTWPLGMQAPEPDDELPDASVSHAAERESQTTLLVLSQ